MIMIEGTSNRPQSDIGHYLGPWKTISPRTSFRTSVAGTVKASISYSGFRVKGLGFGFRGLGFG